MARGGEDGRDGTTRKPNSTLQVDTFQSGTPAPETPLGSIHHTAQGGLDGAPIRNQARDKAPLSSRGGRARVNRQDSVELFITELSNWLRCWVHVVQDKYQIAYRYLQIYNSLKELVLDRSVVLLEGNVHWNYVKALLEYIRFDPSLGITTLKYCALYLNSCYDDIVEYLRHPESGHSINRPDLLSAHTPEDIEAKKKERERKRSEDWNAQFNKDLKEDVDSGGL